MLEHFMRFFRVERTVSSTGNFYQDVISQLGGRTYGKGLLRFFKEEDVPDWMERVRDAFPWVRQQYRLLAFDWLGIIYGIGQNDQDQDVVLVFDLLSRRSATRSREKKTAEMDRRSSDIRTKLRSVPEFRPPIAGIGGIRSKQRRKWNDLKASSPRPEALWIRKRPLPSAPGTGRRRAFFSSP